MTTWTSDELGKIGDAEELRISPRRRDGTLQKPRTVWVVRHGDDLYLRSVRGPKGDWFRGTQARHEGHIRAGGIEKEVAIEEADAGMNDEIDSAFRSKYSRYAGRVLDSVLTPAARSTTLRLVPRSTGS
jgi:hypothetical protein